MRNLDFRVTDFEAVGDGITLNTEAINQGVRTCSESGGGSVIIPPALCKKKAASIMRWQP